MNRNFSSEQTGLYRLWRPDGILLYVGISLEVITRLTAHGRDKLWFHQISNITVLWFTSRSLAEKAEREAIVAEKPLFNITHNEQRGLSSNAFTLKPRFCLECAWPFRPRRVDQECCGSKCRKAITNRQAVQGARIIELAIQWQINRKKRPSEPGYKAPNGKSWVVALSEAVDDIMMDGEADRRADRRKKIEAHKNGTVTALNQRPVGPKKLLSMGF